MTKLKEYNQKGVFIIYMSELVSELYEHEFIQWLNWISELNEWIEWVNLIGELNEWIHGS